MPNEVINTQEPQTLDRPGYEEQSGTTGQEQQTTQEEIQSNDTTDNIVNEGTQEQQTTQDSNDTNNETNNELATENKSSEYDEKVKELGMNSIGEIFETYNQINEILNNPELIKQYSNEEIAELVAAKNNYEGIVNEIKPIMEAQQQEQINKVLGNFDPELKEAITNTFGKDLNQYELETIAKILDIAKSTFSSKVDGNNGNSQENINPTNIGSETSGQKPNPQSGVSFVEGLLSDDPEVRAKARAEADKLFR